MFSVVLQFFCWLLDTWKY